MLKRIFASGASLSLVATLVATGCATVKVLKVGDAPQPEGIPFYLPRPYVQVFEPFVVGSKVYLVSGRVSQDGKYLLIDNAADNSHLDGLYRADPSKDYVAAIPVGQVKPAGTGTALTGGPEGNATPSTAASAPVAAASAASAASSSASAASAPASSPSDSQPVGNFNVSVTNTSSVFAPTLGRRFFDVVWMPDFDEKYVIQATPGLGNLNIGVTMTQGWGLYGLDAKIDNSALVKPLLDFYSTGLDALSKLAKSKIFPGGASTGGPQASADVQQLTAGTRVTIKITRVQVVAPGLYPVLKPKEVSHASEIGQDPRDMVIMHVPNRPYTNIAFNSYEVVIIEAAKPTGDSPMNLQRYFDQVSSDGSVITPAPPTLTNGLDTSFNVDDFTKSVNAALASRKGTDGAVWVLSKLKVAGSKLTGTATLTGGSVKPDALGDMVKLAAFTADQSKSKFLPGDVTLAEAKAAPVAAAFNADAFTKQVNAQLATHKGSGGEIWMLSKLAATGSKLTGTATLTGGKNKPDGLGDLTTLAKFVADQSSKKFAAADITLTEAK